MSFDEEYIDTHGECRHERNAARPCRRDEGRIPMTLVEKVARAVMPTPCDATGESHSIMRQGSYQFCVHCGETIAKSRDLTFQQAKGVARAALDEFAKWHDEMAKGLFAAAKQIDAEWVKGCLDPDDRRSNIKDRDEHYAISHWYEGCANTIRREIDAALKEGE